MGSAKLEYLGKNLPGTQIFFAALRAAGRSVGTDRLKTTQNGDPITLPMPPGTST